MTKTSINSAHRKNSYYCICSVDMLKTYQKETKFFKFPQDSNRKELKIKKTDVTLQWFHFARAWTFKISASKFFINKEAHFRFRFSHSLKFTSKTTFFLTTGYTRKYWRVVKDIWNNKNAALAVLTFLKWLPANND